MNKLLDTFKLQADIDREEIICKEILNDPDYLNALNDFKIKEIQFNALPITSEIRNTILEYMCAWDSIEMEYSTYSYLAGIHRATVEVKECTILCRLRALIRKQKIRFLSIKKAI